MAMPAHLTLTGEKQGKIDGSCEMQGREGTILTYAMTHDISIPRSPTDGLATGKRVHGSLCIVKEFDQSSPKLYQALCTGEHLKDVTIKWYRITKQGTEEHYQAVEKLFAQVLDFTRNRDVILVQFRA